MKEYWKYQGARLALGIHPLIDGQRCYWFRRENVGIGGTTFVIPITLYWANGQPESQRDNTSGAQTQLGA